MIRHTFLLTAAFAASVAVNATPGRGSSVYMPPQASDSIICECINDVTRLDEAQHIIDSLLRLPGIAADDYYRTLQYRQAACHIAQGNFTEAKAVLLAIKDVLPQDIDEDILIGVPHDLSICYRRESKNDSALYYYDYALHKAIDMGNDEWQAAICLNIGVLHVNLGHASEAETYLRDALHLSRLCDDAYTELCAQQVMASILVKQQRYDEARPYANAAYALALESESPDWQLRCLTAMLPIYDALDMPDSADIAHALGDRLLPLLPQQGITARGYVMARAAHYYSRRQWQLAANDFATVLADKTAGTATADVYQQAASTNAQLGRWREAYVLLDSAYSRMRDEGDERFHQQLADFNVRYATIEKDLSIARLKAAQQEASMREQRQRTLATVAAVIIVILAIALTLWLRQRRFRREAGMRIETLEAERRRIARELHDGLCNDMLALEMRLDGDSDTAAQLCGLRQKARDLSHQLMPPEFEHISLSYLLSKLAQTISSQGLNATFNFSGSDATFPPATAHALYRIAQEHTSNIVKGATASLVSITLTDQSLIITDNGNAATATNSGIGHRTLQDNATAIGASLTTTSANGTNTLTVRI